MIKCGIYQIKNIISNMYYVGSSSNLKSRKYAHYRELKNNNHCNNHLQNAYNKLKEEYGTEGIKNYLRWEIIEFVEYDKDTKILKNKLLGREQYYLNEYIIDGRIDHDRCYNMCSEAGSRLGSFQSEETIIKLREVHLGKKHSQETKNKMSKKGRDKIFSQEHRKNLSLSAKGKGKSKEHREKLRLANKEKKLSEEHKNRIRKKVINLTTGEEFKSIKEASEFYNIPTGSISRVCKGNRKTCKGYKWSYSNIEKEQ